MGRFNRYLGPPRHGTTDGHAPREVWCVPAGAPLTGCDDRQTATGFKERAVMTVFWIIGLSALVVIWAITIVDVFRHHHSGSATVGWLVLIVLVPFVGALVYWGMRKPSRDEVEQQYLGEAELRRSTAARPFDSTGL
jgi:hypothetical protein